MRGFSLPRLSGSIQNMISLFFSVSIQIMTIPSCRSKVWSQEENYDDSSGFSASVYYVGKSPKFL